MKKLKENLPIIVTIAIVLLAGALIEGKDWWDSRDLFDKKQECGAMLESTKEKHKLSDKEHYGDSLVTQPTFVAAVFYSPSVNSCLEAYSYGEVYVIRDLLTGEEVYMENVYQDPSAYDRFEAKIDSLK